MKCTITPKIIELDLMSFFHAIQVSSWEGIAYRGLVELLSRDHHWDNETQSMSPNFAFNYRTKGQFVFPTSRGYFAIFLSIELYHGLVYCPFLTLRLWQEVGPQKQNAACQRNPVNHCKSFLRSGPYPAYPASLVGPNVSPCCLLSLSSWRERSIMLHWPALLGCLGTWGQTEVKTAACSQPIPKGQ